MNLFVWLLVGGVFGWMAGKQIKLERRRRRVMPKNIAIGIVGALLGGFLLTPLLGTGRLVDTSFSPVSVLVALLGSLIFMRTVKRYHSISW